MGKARSPKKGRFCTYLDILQFGSKVKFQDWSLIQCLGYSKTKINASQDSRVIGMGELLSNTSNPLVMGGDSSKPNFSEVDSHIKYRNHVNDAYFYEARLLDPEDREALLRGIKKKDKSAYEAAEEYLTSLQGQVTRAEGRIEKLTNETHAKLVMEIRKAMDIIPFGFPKVKGIYVHVQTSPSNLNFKTGLSQPYIPKWYHLGYLSYNSISDDVTNAQLTMYSVGPKDEEAAIASCDIDLRESIDTTQTRWHMLKWSWPFDAKDTLPQIEIRYWNLKNLEAFWTNMKVTAMDEMERIQTAIEYSKSFRLHE